MLPRANCVYGFPASVGEPAAGGVAHGWLAAAGVRVWGRGAFCLALWGGLAVVVRPLPPGA